MDWTGGARKRFAKGKHNAVLARQKAHFQKMAKANAIKAPPDPIPSFMRAAYRSNSYQPLMASATSSSFQAKPDDSCFSQHNSKQSKHLSPGLAARASPRDNTPPGRCRDPSSKSTNLPGHPYVGTAVVAADALLAQKQRLLARSDWLGLAVAKPLHLNFNRNRDNDRVGKRRKIDKSSSHPTFIQKHHERVPTPLFRSRLGERDALMSGALPNSDIQIKIGTEALATQTQPSRHSITPVHTSIRPMSAASSSLSEESMLLDVDEDGFELGTAQTYMHLPNFARPTYSHAVDPSTLSPHTEDRTPPARNQEETLTLQSWSPSALEGAIAHTSDPPEFGLPTHPESAQQDVLVVNSRRESRSYSSDRCQAVVEGHMKPAPATATPMTSPSQDETWWKRALQVPDNALTQASIIALRSSSAHSSAFATSDWPLAGRPVYHNVFAEHITGDSAEPDQAVDERRIQEVSCALPDAQVEMSKASHRAIAPAKSLLQTEAVGSQERDDDALWRSFIVGSSDRDSISADGPVKTPHAMDTESQPLSPAPRSTSQPRSPEARSDMATVGRSTHFDQLSSLNTDENESSVAITNTSLVGHATTNHPDDGSAEDEPTPPNGDAHRDNIHTTLVSAFRQRRLKQPKQRKDRGMAKVKTFRAAITTSTRATAHTKSVFDVSSSV